MRRSSSNFSSHWPGIAKRGDAVTQLPQRQLRIVLDVEVRDRSGRESPSGRRDRPSRRRRARRPSPPVRRALIRSPSMTMRPFSIGAAPLPSMMRTLSSTTDGRVRGSSGRRPRARRNAGPGSHRSRAADACAPPQRRLTRTPGPGSRTRSDARWRAHPPGLAATARSAHSEQGPLDAKPGTRSHSANVSRASNASTTTGLSPAWRGAAPTSACAMSSSAATTGPI